MDDLKFTTAEDYMMEQHFEEIKACLQKGIVEIKFTKVNGDERVMLATLSEDLIPMDLRPKDDAVVQPRVPNPDVQRVYDVEADGWRSFRWDSLMEWSIA